MPRKRRRQENGKRKQKRERQRTNDVPTKKTGNLTRSWHGIYNSLASDTKFHKGLPNQTDFFLHSSVIDASSASPPSRRTQFYCIAVVLINTGTVSHQHRSADQAQSCSWRRLLLLLFTFFVLCLDNTPDHVNNTTSLPFRTVITLLLNRVNSGLTLSHGPR